MLKLGGGQERIWLMVVKGNLFSNVNSIQRSFPSDLSTWEIRTIFFLLFIKNIHCKKYLSGVLSLYTDIHIVLMKVRSLIATTQLSFMIICLFQIYLFLILYVLLFVYAHLGRARKLLLVHLLICIISIFWDGINMDI